MKGITQDSIAITYAFILAQEPNADFAAINAAIRARYKGAGALIRIKQAAWRQFEEWGQNADRKLQAPAVDGERKGHA